MDHILCRAYRHHIDHLGCPYNRESAKGLFRPQKPHFVGIQCKNGFIHSNQEFSRRKIAVDHRPGCVGVSNLEILKSSSNNDLQ